MFKLTLYGDSRSTLAKNGHSVGGVTLDITVNQNVIAGSGSGKCIQADHFVCRSTLCMHKPHAEKYSNTLFFYQPLIEVEILSSTATGRGGTSHAVFLKLSIQAGAAWNTQFWPHVTPILDPTPSLLPCSSRIRPWFSIIAPKDHV